MPKEQFHLYVDSELKWKAKRLHINVSKVLNDVLRSMICQYTKDDVNILEIKEEIENLQDEMSNIQIKMNELRAQELAYEQKKKEFDKKSFEELKKKMHIVQQMDREGVI